MAAVLCAVIFFGGQSRTVGKNIKIDDINEFYYTVSTSTNPPYYQRYRFYNENGKHYFYHEKREGDHWPLMEEDATETGTLELNDRQWEQFFSYITGGKVEKRKEYDDTGRSGPWLFLYWKNDRSEIQEYSFESLEKRFGFEEFCLKLKGQ